MNEKIIEKKLVKTVKNMGGMALKFISPGMDGVPDRIVLFPGGRMGFVELKAPRKKLRPLQMRRMAQICRLGFMVYVVDGQEQIDEVIQKIGGDAQ